MADSSRSQLLVSTHDIAKEFAPRRRLFQRAPSAGVWAVDGVSISIARGRTLGLVGESGCGKSTLARMVIGLIKPTSGRVEFEGRDLATLDKAELRAVRQRFQMVFQDPMGSLDPRMRIVDSIAEPLHIADRGSKADQRDRALSMLEEVGLSREHGERYPHEFSGGQRQRICIGRALVLDPDLIIADEPASALDVSIRAQVINLLQDMQERTRVAYLFISHDLNLVRHVAHEVAVMYLGEIVEQGPSQDVIDRPLHPYSQALRASTPVPRVTGVKSRIVAQGDVADSSTASSGCRFRGRCPVAMPRCADERPRLRAIGGDRLAACHVL